MNTTIYLCGGIAGLSDAQCNDWRTQVKKELPQVAYSTNHADIFFGLDFLDPMRRDYRGVVIDDALAHRLCKEDKKDIQSSDIILAMCPVPSWGTAMEIMYAYDKLDKWVVVVCNSPKVSPWLMEHSDYLVGTLEEAYAAITTIMEGMVG